jgi:hypothetical protein
VPGVLGKGGNSQIADKNPSVSCRISGWFLLKSNVLLVTYLIGGLEHFFPYIGNNSPNCQYFSEGLKPPTRYPFVSVCYTKIFIGDSSADKPFAACRFYYPWLPVLL